MRIWCESDEDVHGNVVSDLIEYYDERFDILAFLCMGILRFLHIFTLIEAFNKVEGIS